MERYAFVRRHHDRVNHLHHDFMLEVPADALDHLGVNAGIQGLAMRPALEFFDATFPTSYSPLPNPRPLGYPFARRHKSTSQT
jgi:hypothetical protein